MHLSHPTGNVCQRILLSGIVQGVGFRPFVLRLARELDLSGWVRSNAQGIEIEASGDSTKITELLHRLRQDAPASARIDAMSSRLCNSVSNSGDFSILESRGGRSTTAVPSDTVICHSCLQDMFDPQSRRWRYPFTHCSHCGPRYALCKELPFDRQRTSFAPFTRCNRCQAEYKRENDPRFHAEGISCPKCGPQLTLYDKNGKALRGDPVSNAYALLQQGKIVAIKELGCIHLFCDARHPEAVNALRERKKRFAKPFSVMFANALSAARYVHLNIGEPGLLNLPERPIILLKKRSSADKEFPKAAPNMPWLGVSLPFSPVHYLLFHEALGRPENTDWLGKTQDLALVMTSGNTKREPPVYANADAFNRLAGIADAFLLHDREILTHCEDSVARTGPGGLQLVRRSRGYVPKSIKLPRSSPAILAVGSDTKNTLCFTRDDEAFVSQHIGEIEGDAALGEFSKTLGHLQHLLDISPACIAHDLQAGFAVTQFAKSFAKKHGIPAIGIQHHHAHIAAILAEHQHHEPIVALALDSGALAADGSVWGGELLRVDGAYFERLSHLAPLNLVGYQKAQRNPWHMASALLHALGRTGEISTRFAQQPDATSVAQTLQNNQSLPISTSMGAIQRGVAGLLGLVETALFRDQTLLILEGAAERHGDIAPLADGWRIEHGALNLLPLMSVLADEKNPERGAALFYATLAAALTEWTSQFVAPNSTLAVSGGCLQDQVLRRQLRGRLNEAGYKVLEPRYFPPNDGALSLGQAWVAQQYLLGNTPHKTEQTSEWTAGAIERRKNPR